MSQQGKRKTKFSGSQYITKSWKFFCVLYAHSQFLCNRRCGFTIRLKRLKPRAPGFVIPQSFGSWDDFQHFCRQLYLYICFGSTHVFFNMPPTKDLYRTGVSKLFDPRATCVIVQQCEGRTSYVMWLFRVMLYSTKSKNVSSINFSLFTKSIRGPDLACSLYFRVPWCRRMSEKVEDMRMSILLLWRWDLVIVTYNVWNKTPECYLSLVAFHG